MELFQGKRIVFCADSLEWLENRKNIKAIITSLPDMEEISEDLKGWERWVRVTANQLIDSLADDGVIFFYQTNRKYKGGIIDKNQIITHEFLERGYTKILEKIVLKQKPNTINLFRPGYTNLFAFSKTLKAGKATPDVIECGKMVYKNAMGYNAVELCLDYIEKKVDTDTINDPFCGQGSVLKISNNRGFKAIGVDIDNEQCLKAEQL